VNDLANR